MAKAWLRGLAPLILLSCSEAPAGPANAAHAEAAAAQARSPYRPLAAPDEHRLEPFSAVTPVPEEGSEEAEHQSARYCTADRIWCAQLERGASRWSLLVIERTPGDARAPAPLYFEPPGQAEGEPHFEIWPMIVREAGGAVLIGVETRRRTSYSGGGASMSRLTLVRVGHGGAGMAEVLEVPVGARASIRACFTEEDRRARQEACADEYEFAAALSVIPPRAPPGDAQVDRPPAADGGGAGVASGRPVLLYQTRACTYPGRRSRVEDSTAGAPLRRADLAHHWEDPECSYSRTFTYDAASHRYRPDTPLPACDDYLDFDWPSAPPGD